MRAPGHIARGAVFVYDLEVENPEYDLAYGVTMEAALPAGVSVRRVTAAGWNCTQSKQTVSCSAEELRPGRHAIVIEATAPSATGSINATATVSSLGVFDPVSGNDTARSQLVVYDPSACVASAPVLDPPHAQEHMSMLAWSAVAGAARYDVFLSVEKEAFHRVAQTVTPSADLLIENGDVEWFVEAVFGGCPPARSATQQFRSIGPAARLLVDDFAGVAGRSGSEDGAAATATFSDPVSITIGNEGEIYVAERESSTVRQIRNGAVTTFIGRAGVAGSVDGDSNAQARLRAPMGVAASRQASGLTLYVADTGNQTIRQAFPGVYVSTVAGAPASSGHRDGLGAQVRFSSPAGLAHDNHGTLYIADSANHVIRTAENEPRTIVQLETKTLAGVGGREGNSDGAAALFRRPMGLAVDAAGIVYVADTGNNAIRRIDTAGNVTTIAAGFDTPTSVAVDAFGNLFVCDSGNHVIRKVSPSGRVTIVAGAEDAPGHANGLGSAALFREPFAIAMDIDGTLYIADRGNRIVRRASIVIAPPAARRRSVGK